MTVDATTPSGAQVSFAAAASDGQGEGLPVVCTPASGTTFPIATTTVRCSATDAHGLSAHGSFTVHVSGAAEQLTNLDALLAGMNLDKGLTKDLQARLDDAPKKLDKPNEACKSLTDFPVKVIDEAGSKSPRLTIPQAQQLTHGAVAIEGVVGCLAPGSPVGDAANQLLALMQAIDGLGLPGGEDRELTARVSDAGERLVAGKLDDACRRLADLAKKLADDTGKKNKLTAAQAAQLAAALAPIRSGLGC
jgi:hypothetical protein